MAIYSDRSRRYRRIRRGRKRVIGRISVLMAVACCITAVWAITGHPLQSRSNGLHPEEAETLSKNVRTVSEMTPIALSSDANLNVGERQADKQSIVLVNWEHPIDYTPNTLVSVNSVCSIQYVDLQSYDLMVDSTAGQAANEMFRAACEEGVGRYIINSAYRSVEAQSAIWEHRIQQDPMYGSDPYNSPVKAMPGNMSEHATGLALDILCVSHNLANDSYGETAEGQWLEANAHRFGFIQRYPQNKEHITGVIYEPWHYRYVGIEAATEIYEQGLCLEEYLA